MLMTRFARWHIWLGWLVAIPLLVWTVSGVVMTLRPIEEVRGGALRAEPAPVAPGRLVFPQLTRPVAKAVLISQGARAVWVVTGTDQQLSRFDARSGAALGPVGPIEARELADAAYAGKAALLGLRRFEAAQAPLDLRRPRPSWQAGYDDGTHVYIDADTGEVLALRSRWWRFYDFMWGLHIMDPMGREETSHVLLWLFGALAFAGSLFGTILLFRRRRAG
jgi:hypothetical protein